MCACVSVCVCVCVCVRVCVWLPCPWEEEKTLRVSDLAREAGGKTEENVFLQRDCIQSLKTVIWDMNSLHGLSSVAVDNVMQQRRLASHSARPEPLWRRVCPPARRPPAPSAYLRCHNAWLLRVCGRGGFAPSSSESVRWMLSFTAVVRGPVQAATVTCPLTGILVPSHSVSETRGKVFKLDLENKEIQRNTRCCLLRCRLVEFACAL